MPYLEINNYPIFISSDRERFLAYELIDDPSERVATSLRGKARQEFSKKSIEYLMKQYKRNKKEFLKEWFKFSLLEQEARISLYNILVDYSHYYGHSYLEDVRSDYYRMIQDRLGDDSLNFPLGNAYFLCIKQQETFINRFFKEASPSSKILINSNNVYKIEGDLKSFTIFMSGMIIHLSNEISVYPTKDLKRTN